MRPISSRCANNQQKAACYARNSPRKSVADRSYLSCCSAVRKPPSTRSTRSSPRDVSTSPPTFPPPRQKGALHDSLGPHGGVLLSVSGCPPAAARLARPWRFDLGPGGQSLLTDDRGQRLRVVHLSTCGLRSKMGRTLGGVEPAGGERTDLVAVTGWWTR